MICFDVTPLEGRLNTHVLREMTYTNGLILEWEANHYIPPVCVFMDVPGATRLSWRSAADVNLQLCGTASGARNNLRLTRSVALLDYDDPAAQAGLVEDLLRTKAMVLQPGMPNLYNSVLRPYELDHPVLKRTLRATRFVPYYLRDEQFLGFKLACTLPVEFDGPATAFWSAVRRALPFSSILQKQFVDWLSDSAVGLNERRADNVLKGLLSAVQSAPEIASSAMTIVQRLLEAPTSSSQCHLLQEYSRQFQQMSDVAPSFVTETDSELAPTSRPAESTSPSLYPNLFSLTLTESFLDTICQERSELWPGIFGSDSDSVQSYFHRSSPQMDYLQLFGEQMRNLAIAEGSFDDALRAAQDELGEDAFGLMGIDNPSLPRHRNTGSEMGRYFTVTGGVTNPGIYEDALDNLVPTLIKIVGAMRLHGYSDRQIETAARSGLLVRLICTRARVEELAIEEMVRPYRSVIEFISGERDLELFEFQSTVQGRVNRAAFPWGNVRGMVVEYLATVASEKLGISLEEARIPYQSDYFPPAQIWGMLVSTRMWQFCDEAQFRDWWSKYAVCEYINRETPGAFILNVGEIDRWAPLSMA